MSLYEKRLIALKAKKALSYWSRLDRCEHPRDPALCYLDAVLIGYTPPRYNDVLARHCKVQFPAWRDFRTSGSLNNLDIRNIEKTDSKRAFLLLSRAELQIAGYPGDISQGVRLTCQVLTATTFRPVLPGRHC